MYPPQGYGQGLGQGQQGTRPQHYPQMMQYPQYPQQLGNQVPQAQSQMQQPGYGIPAQPYQQQSTEFGDFQGGAQAPAAQQTVEVVYDRSKPLPMDFFEASARTDQQTQGPTQQFQQQQPLPRREFKRGEEYKKGEIVLYRQRDGNYVPAELHTLQEGQPLFGGRLRYYSKLKNVFCEDCGCFSCGGLCYCVTKI
eukprot:TRINITY_DN3708_c2_g2_i1.p3 TRINITY_DN3708_c2_g2~~TRINITY_DN3708_c2_g2_i1.p3  ORF type:complete len:195 (-),score=15.48 TRINITY_DN3708_c2_g2_i1:142-726(-)